MFINSELEVENIVWRIHIRLSWIKYITSPQIYYSRYSVLQKKNKANKVYTCISAYIYI